MWTSELLTESLKIAGQPMVNLTASTSGTDSDWVVKLIDVYPDEVAGQPQMGGYQLMVSADIFRGRYREGFETAKAIEPNKPLPYRFALPTANHVFLKGHRLMVQVQSAWFPLYDRNPQTFVPNIFWAKPELQKGDPADLPLQLRRTAYGQTVTPGLLAISRSWNPAVRRLWTKPESEKVVEGCAVTRPQSADVDQNHLSDSSTSRPRTQCSPLRET